ncbi:MAG: cupin domain-containing protein [Boseongicola sp.]
MAGAHTIYAEAEKLEFPPQISLSILLSGAQTNGALSVFEDIVEPGVGPGRHIHHGEDETFFVLDGQFDVEIAGVRHHAGPGDVAFVPRGAVHAFRNVGETPGRLRYAFTPAGNVEAMFRAMFAAADGGVPSMEDMARIALEHGQEFVGPPLEP